MHKNLNYILIVVSVLLAAHVSAQNIGVNQQNPQSDLDINGNISIGSSYSGVNTAPVDGAIIEGQSAIGTPTPNSSAMLDVVSTSKGLLIPRMTTAQRTAIGSPATSLLVFDITTNSFWFHNGTDWTQLVSTGSDSDAQTLSIALDSLAISDGNKVDLAPYLDNTDNQDLGLSGNTLSLTNDVSSVDLSGYLDNTDAQTLNFADPNLSISGGNSVDLSGLSAADTDWAIEGDTALYSGPDSTVIIKNSQVGIGKAPTNLLDIKADIAESVVISVESAPSSGTADRIFEIVQTNVGTSDTDGELRMGNRFNNGATPDDVVISSNGASYLKGGSLGIGTTSPGRLLEVQDSDTYVGLVLDNIDAAGEKWDLIVGGTGSVNEGALSIWNGSHRLIVDDAGNVGVGEASPAQKLDVAGSVNIENDLYVGNGSATDDDIIFFDQAGSENFRWKESASRFELSDDLYSAATVIAENRFIGDLNVDDSRDSNYAPVFYDKQVNFDFKRRSSIGAPGSGTYGGMMTFAPWSDNSGDSHHQLFFSDDGIYHRKGLPNDASWNSWDRILTDSSVAGNYINNQTSTDQSAGFRIDGNGIFNGGKIGVGNTSPSAEVDVVDAASSAIVKASGNGVGTTHSEFVSDRNAGNRGVGMRLTTSGDTDWWAGIGYDNGNATADFMIDTNDRSNDGAHLFIEGATGEIGINTASPTAGVDIYQKSLRVRRDADQYIELEDGTASGGFITNHSRGANKKPLYIQSIHDTVGTEAGSTQMIFRLGDENATTEAMRILEDGKIGIGTASPTEKLHVAGSIKMVDGNQSAGRVLTSDANGVASWQDAGGSDNDWTISGNTMYNANSGAVGIGTSTPGTTHPHTDFEIVDEGNFAGVSITTYNQFSYLETRRANGTEASPTVVSDGDRLGYHSFLGYSGTAFNDAAFILAEVDGVPGENDMPGRMSFYTTPDGSNSAQERLRITQNGNIGIGTSSPDEKLHIAGSLKLVDGNQSAGRVLTSDANGVASWQDAAGGSLWTESAGDVYRSTGDVGIGTTNPIVKFQIDQDVTETNFWHRNIKAASTANKVSWHQIVQSSAFNRTAFEIESSLSNITDGSRRSLVEFKTAWAGNDITAMSIDGNEIGIGTVAPTAKLHIKQNVDAAGGGLRIEHSGDTNGWDLFSKADAHFYLAYNSTDLVTVHNNGRMGIGTTAPSHILHINGQGRSTSSNWATTSDVRAKENIHNIENALNLLDQMRPVTYEWKEAYKRGREDLNELNYGFISQEMEQIIPSMVSEVEERFGETTIPDFKLLNTDPLVPLLVSAVKQLKAENTALKNENFRNSSEIELIKAALMQAGINLDSQDTTTRVTTVQE